MNTPKNLSIETLRGITILLVVIGHVIGSAPDGGMKIDFPHPLRYVYLWIDYIQMPLFTAIAGWVYALRPFSASSALGSFIRKKAKRLLLPMVTVVTLYFLIQYFMPGTNNKGNLNEMWRIYLFPYTIYWYLPSLFLIFVIQALVDKYRLMEGLKQWMCCILVAFVLSQINDVGIVHDIPNVLSFKGAWGQLPYFFTGVAAFRFFLKIRSQILKWIFVSTSLFGVVLIQLVWFYPGEVEDLCRVLYSVTLIPTLLLLLSLKWHNRFFVMVGSYAYSIYLFHGFGTSGGRIILKILGVKSGISIFVIAALIASVCPVVIDKLASRRKWSRLLLLGK